MQQGVTFKRCGCRDPQTARPLGPACPALRRGSGSWSPSHGRWYYRLELPPDPNGKRQRLERGSFASHRDAKAELDHAADLLALADRSDPHQLNEVVGLLIAARRTSGPLPSSEEVRRRLGAGVPLDQLPTVTDWLAQWLAGRRKIRPNTHRSYESHIRLYLTAHLGHHRLDRLRVGHLDAMFDAIDEHNQYIAEARASHDPAVRATVKGQRIVGAASKQRIRATLRAALNEAIRRQLLTTNVAGFVELPAGKRPKPLVWTPERVARWQATGERPSPVMVWTPAQTGQFLDHAAKDPLYPLYHLAAFRGLRRGELCGLRWSDVDLDSRELAVRKQLAQIGWRVELTDVKTDSSHAPVALDANTVQVLRAHRASQHKQHLAAGPAWNDTNVVFARPNGQQLHPAEVTDRFLELTAQAGLPPIRLHDLRHGAATLALAAGADLKVVQETLRHSSITITADTYTSVLPQVAYAAAEATAALVPRNALQEGTRAQPPQDVKRAG
jgi:integrase